MNQYSSRRNKLLNNLEDNSIMLLFSGQAPMYSEDEAYDFRVNHNFYYLSGLDKENMVLLISKINGVSNETLFILPFDETLAKWVGGRMLKEEATRLSEIQDVRQLEELDESLASLLDRNRGLKTINVYLDLWRFNMDQADTPAHEYAYKLKDKYPQLLIKDAFNLLTTMRLVKDQYEIDCVRKAISITNVGIRQMMKYSKPNINEMVMEGVFSFSLNQCGCKKVAFPTIAASGPRSTILHYSDNNHMMNDGDMFLCDLGATYNYYNADISRSFPVNGKFTDRQKEIYNVVLAAQRIVEANAKAGVNIRDLNKMVVDFYKEELPKHNLNKDVREYYYHSVSHQIGLDVHECDGGLGLILKPGNIISNEPGLYISDEGFGIRIEDDLLIKEDGCENLSVEIVKDPEQIEEIMKKL